MSLRARLLAAMLLIATAGLLAADAATYRFLASFLVDRVDQQFQVATLSAVQALNAPSLGGPFGGGGGGPLLTPPGTYVALLDAEGEVTAEEVLVVQFDEEVPSPPELPDGLPGSTEAGSTTGPATFTAPAQEGDAEYRVRAYAIRRPVVAATLVVAIPLTDVAGTLGRLVLIEAAVTLAVLTVLGLLSWWLVRLGLRPLERMGETADAIAGGELSRRVEPADPRTEVGRLGLALNAMLARIEEAFAERRASEERLRRFVADASHELRTPLTSVQGYAELFRRGAAERPDDLSAAMRRIEEESARMGELVDELALLARLDQGRPLDREPVDLVAVTTAAVDAARVADPGRTFDLQTRGPIRVLGDAGRLRQVADNLLSNARVHTPTGSPVRVRVRAEGADAILEVEDEGPGVPAEDAARVFERFYRGDPSRSRESGGAGLGLSIVDAVARGHGGSARCEPASGGGALFVVTLPLGERRGEAPRHAASPPGASPAIDRP